MFPQREPTPLQPQHREESIRPSVSTTSRKCTDSTSTAAATASFTNSSLNTMSYACRANTVSKSLVGVPRPPNKAKAHCAQRMPAHNAIEVFGNTTTFTVSPNSAISITTDSTEFTMPPAYTKSKGKENISLTSILCAGDVKGHNSAPDPLLGLCVQLLNRSQHDLRTITAKNNTSSRRKSPIKLPSSVKHPP